MSFDEVSGFAFAVAGTPELVPPSEWLPEAFNGEMPEFESGRALEKPERFRVVGERRLAQLRTVHEQREHRSHDRRVRRLRLG